MPGNDPILQDWRERNQKKDAVVVTSLISVKLKKLLATQGKVRYGKAKKLLNAGDLEFHEAVVQMAIDRKIGVAKIYNDNGGWSYEIYLPEPIENIPR